MRVNGIRWGELGFCSTSNAAIGGDCNGRPKNDIRYDSPTYAGFSVRPPGARTTSGMSAAVMRVSSAASRSPQRPAILRRAQCGGQSPGPADTCLNDPNNKIGYLQSGLYVEHVATGLFAYGAYGRRGSHERERARIRKPPGALEVKGGLRERWNSLGSHGALWRLYAAERHDQRPRRGYTCSGHGLRDQPDELREWSVGAVQEIDAAAMSLWLQYRQLRRRPLLTRVVSARAWIKCSS